MRFRIAIVGTVLAWASVAVADSASSPAADASCRSVTASTCATASALGRGVNFGEMLEAPREGDWGHRVEAEFIDQATPVFKTIRLPVRWSNHAAPSEDATLDKAFAERVDSIVDTLLARNVYVILDLHGYSQLMGAAPMGNEFAVDPDVVDKRFVNIWEQLAERYRTRSPKLIFELLNEPSGRMDGPQWNALGAKALQAIRKTNPDRIVMFGPSGGNHSRGLASLSFARDSNIIVPIHNYDPFNFTHQGISWNPYFSKRIGVTCCDKSQRQAVIDALDVAKRWSLANGYPVSVGEFGTYGKGELAYRVEYTRFFRDEAERRGFSWTYWNFVGSFGVYSSKDHEWVEALKAALLN